MNRRLPKTIVVGFLLFSACSGTDQPAGPAPTADQAPTPTTSSTVPGLLLDVEPIAAPELDPDLTGEDLLVAIEARWMCDVQRFAFSDLEAMSQALSERLTPHGLSREDYDSFKTDLEDRIDLRERVLAEYDVYCNDD